MSLLICTPAYGGQVTLAYFNSCLDLKENLLSVGLKHDWLTTDKESLIQRGRNTMASRFLRETDFERLLFIDADIEFDSDDVAKLWNLQADVSVGVYAMKDPKKARYAAWWRGNLLNLSECPEEPFEVDYAGTGFMMIHRSVLEKMKEVSPEHQEGEVGQCWAFFNPRVVGDVYLSEDYSFCHDWRSIGGKIIMDPSVRLKHHGTYAYG